MGVLVYGMDRRLREGERVLADYSKDGPYGSIVVGGAEYEIEHVGRTGWHFRLTAADGGAVCTYDPYPVVRGGRLRGRWAEVRLRGTALRPRRWVFSGEPGWRLQAEVVTARWLPEEGESRLSAGSSFEVRLSGEPPILSGELTIQLAFGCWILFERQSMPVEGGGGGG